MGQLPQNRKRWFLISLVKIGILLNLCIWVYLGVQLRPPFFDGNIGKQREVATRTGENWWETLELTSLEKTLEKWENLQSDHAYNQASPSLDSPNTDQSELSDFIRRQPLQDFQIASHNGLVQFLKNASCTPIPASLVLYNRVFKTGSETMGSHFELAAGVMNYVYTKRETEDYYDEGISGPYPEIIEEGARNVRQQILFNAHFYFRNNLKVLRTHTYINQVREPVARYISHYFFKHNTRHRNPLHLQKMIDSGEINDTIEECFEKQGKGCKYNVMTWFFCGPEAFCKSDPQTALEKAKENIVKYYAVVGLLEHFHLTLQLIQKRLPCFLPVIPRDPHWRDNKGTKKNVSEEMITKIKQANWADIKLYEFVKELFWRQVKSCGITEKSE